MVSKRPPRKKGAAPKKKPVHAKPSPRKGKVVARTKTATAKKQSPSRRPAKAPKAKASAASRAAAAKPRKSRGKARTVLTPDYRPLEGEPFMNPVMLEYFRQKLLRWRDQLLAESNETLQVLQEGNPPEPDIADRAAVEIDRTLQLRTRDRARKLINKIDDALRRVENGTYGYCEETHEPISLRRLEARPIATLSIEAQERHERLERTRRDD